MSKKIEKIAVIGLGTLGTQIAIQAAYYGCSVRGYDQDPEIFSKTIQKVKGMMKILGKGPTMPVEEWEKASSQVKLAKDFAAANKIAAEQPGKQAVASADGQAKTDITITKPALTSGAAKSGPNEPADTKTISLTIAVSGQ